MALRQTKAEVARAPGHSYARWTATIAVLGMLAVAGKYSWNTFATSIRTQPRYLVTADSIEIPQPPAWIRRDIKREVLQDAGLTGTLSILDDRAQLHERLHQAFRFHPWVRSVERIELKPPATVEVALAYRKPIAAVESASQEQTQLLVLDGDLVRLPEMDLTEAEKRYLPRIHGITNRPLVGETWSDERVTGAVQLITALGDAWTRLYLVDVIPSESPEVTKQNRFYVYDLVTTGGTRIVWGAAPGQEPPGETPFAEKLKQLKSFVAQNGPLNSMHTPETINLRTGLTVEQRTVKQLDAADEDGEIRK
jgi:hypothetical protein